MPPRGRLRLRPRSRPELVEEDEDESEELVPAGAEVVWEEA